MDIHGNGPYTCCDRMVAMGRLFDYEVETNSTLSDRMILEEKNRIRSKCMGIVDDLTLSRFFHIVDTCKPSDSLRLEDPDQTHSWDNRILVDVYKMVTKGNVDVVRETVRICNIKFGTDKVPVNYLTSIFRSSIKKKINKHNLIRGDMDEIMGIWKMYSKDNIPLLNQKVNEKFSMLTIKINRLDIDRESKLSLMTYVNDNHRRFQEWIQKNLK